MLNQSYFGWIKDCDFFKNKTLQEVIIELSLNIGPFLQWLLANAFNNFTLNGNLKLLRLNWFFLLFEGTGAKLNILLIKKIIQTLFQLIKGDF